MAATSDNSGHTATLRSTQIRQSQTSYVRKSLGDIVGSKLNKWDEK